MLKYEPPFPFSFLILRPCSNAAYSRAPPKPCKHFKSTHYKGLVEENAGIIYEWVESLLEAFSALQY